jgi:DNA-dependent RNA polymerase auxiliary subunit epsilon
VRLAGLRAEADGWLEQSRQLDLVRSKLADAHFNTEPLGPFRDFVNAYEQQRTRVQDLAADGSRYMVEVATTLRAIGKRYAELDTRSAQALQQITEVG